MPGNKAATLLTAPTLQADPCDLLEIALRAHLVGALGGDPYRDIDALDVTRDPDGRLYFGTWRGHLRLTAGVMIHNGLLAEVALIATKGTLVADESLFGKSGPDVGNTVLVARLLHIALFALRCSGIAAVRNDPVDARVRQLYEDMGFQNGQYLALDDGAALTKAFTYIEQAYQHAAAVGRLSLASPPLPF